MGQRQTGHVERIACMAVKRAMQAGPDMSGVTKSTQTAGSYSESLSYANPAGDLYLTTSERKRWAATARHDTPIWPEARHERRDHHPHPPHPGRP